MRNGIEAMITDITATTIRADGHFQISSWKL